MSSECDHCGLSDSECRCVESKLRDDVDGLEEAIMRIQKELEMLRQKIKELEARV